MEIYDVKSTTQHSGTNLYKTKQNRTEQSRTEHKKFIFNGRQMTLKHRNKQKTSNKGKIR